MMFPATWSVDGHYAGCECGWGVGVLLAGWIKPGGKQGERLGGGQVPL